MYWKELIVLVKMFKRKKKPITLKIKPIILVVSISIILSVNHLAIALFARYGSKTNITNKSQIGYNFFYSLS